MQLVAPSSVWISVKLFLCIFRGEKAAFFNYCFMLQKSFLAAYESVKGEHKRLRNVPERDGGQTWDIVRNNALKDLKLKVIIVFVKSTPMVQLSRTLDHLVFTM